MKKSLSLLALGFVAGILYREATTERWLRHELSQEKARCVALLSAMAGTAELFHQRLYNAETAAAAPESIPSIQSISSIEPK